MVLAPLVALLLGAVVLAMLWGLGGGTLLLGSTDHGPGFVTSSPSPLIAAVMTVALLALLTRAMHLDGLADVADGLGSGRDRDRALAVMRQSDQRPEQ